MKDHGRPPVTGSRGAAKAEVVALYRRAFALYGARALWNIKEFAYSDGRASAGDHAPASDRGDMGARRLAERIEEAARAHL